MRRYLANQSSNQSPRFSWLRLLLIGCLFVASGSGCRLLTQNWLTMIRLHDDDSTLLHETRRNGGLPNIQRAIDTVKLQIMFVERPVGDPLFAEDALWESIASINSDSPTILNQLEKNGFRVGHSSSTPNRAIESLLGLKTDPSAGRTLTDSQRVTGQQIVRPSGGETTVQTNEIVPKSHVEIKTIDGVRVKQFNQSRGVLRVTAKRLQDGWAELEMLPEIHHGRHGYRPVSSADGWKRATGQEIHRLYGHRFKLALNVGEMVIITANDAAPNSLGDYFFHVDRDGQRFQRVLMIRLVDLKKQALLPSR